VGLPPRDFESRASANSATSAEHNLILAKLRLRFNLNQSKILPMIPVTELKTGRFFKLDGQPYQVVEYKHTKLGRGTANIKVKVRHLRTGSLSRKTFISGARVEPLETEIKELQYLYRDAHEAYFMDPRSFEQFSLPLSILGSKVDFFQEGGKVKIFFCQSKPVSVELPVSLTFRVKESPPGVKGNSATTSFKQVVLSNGLTVKAPLFIKKGDIIRIDTRTGDYIERVK